MAGKGKLRERPSRSMTTTTFDRPNPRNLAASREFKFRLPETAHARLCRWCANTGATPSSAARTLLLKALERMEPDHCAAE